MLKRVIVRETGLSGLACALRLASLGFAVTVAHRPDGLELDGFHFDATPSVLAGRVPLDTLLQSLGERSEDWIDLIPVPVTSETPIRGLPEGPAWYPQGGMAALARALVAVGEKNGVAVADEPVDGEAATVAFPAIRGGAGCLVVHLGVTSAYPRKGLFSMLPGRLLTHCPTWTDRSLAPAGHHIYQLVAPGAHGGRPRAAELVTAVEAQGHPGFGAKIALSYVTGQATPPQFDVAKQLTMGAATAQRFAGAHR